MSDFTREKFYVSIDPDTLEYTMQIDYAKIGHIRDVCSDIIRRIDAGNLDVKEKQVLEDSTEDDKDYFDPYN